MPTDLIIIGGGAAGLFAAGLAAANGLAAVLLERRHRCGLKILLSGNNRCNFSHTGTAEQLRNAYGGEIGGFLEPALRGLPPEKLRRMLSEMGLESIVSGGRLYPATGKADDVLHALLDRLRDGCVPLVTNCPVTSLRQDASEWQVECPALALRAPAVLLCTGGFSFPKTGSVGDGEQFARRLGLRFVPPRPGLAGQELDRNDTLARFSAQQTMTLDDVIVAAEGVEVPACRGNLIADRGLLRGSAVYDLNRLAAHRNVECENLLVDFFPGLKLNALEQRLNGLAGGSQASAVRLLGSLGLPPAWAHWLAGNGTDLTAALLRAFPLRHTRCRPLKEAIVTVGGLAREEFDPATMGAVRFPGLYAAGEVLDIDGPTGGYNLHAAFATAKLAVEAVAARLGRAAGGTAGTQRHCTAQGSPEGDGGTAAVRCEQKPLRKSAGAPKNAKSAWGSHFWDERKGRQGRRC